MVVIIAIVKNICYYKNNKRIVDAWLLGFPHITFVLKEAGLITESRLYFLVLQQEITSTIRLAKLIIKDKV